MNRRIIRLLTLITALCACLLLPAAASAADDSGWTGNVNLALGGKSLDHSDWGTLDTQPSIAAELDFRKVSWPVNIAVDFLYSSDDDTLFIHREASTWELDLGVRKVFESLGIVKPFVGGGLAIVNGRFKEEGGIDESDTGVGFWLDGGVYFTFWQHFNVGGEVRYSNATVTLGGHDVDAGGLNYALLLGYHF